MLKAVNLLCEYRVEPLGMDEPHPRLSWQLKSTSRGALQSAYRVQVFMEDGDSPIWDSGKVPSKSSLHAEYAGPSLRPCTRYRFRVRVWDTRGRDSGFSEEMSWETGLMSWERVSARWITMERKEEGGQMLPPIRFRRAFSIQKKVTRARVYASAMGVYALRLNGRRVSDDLLSPGWTSYQKRLQYQTWDVTGILQNGENALAATVADGWYHGRISLRNNRRVYGDKTGFLLQMHIRYEDGSEEVLITDAAWHVSDQGPIRWADFYRGIAYDARMELPGWDAAGYDDSLWRRADILYFTRSTLTGQMDPPIRRQLTLPPSAVITTPKGETVLDFGQNMVGWLRFRVQGPAGWTVTVKHAEVLDQEGNFYTENYRSAESKIEYTLRGGAPETFEPDFIFFGFRYVMLENWPCAIRPSDFSGIVIHSDLAVHGGFECSNERVNQLWHNIEWGQRGNFVDVPTDCPQRDERLGWTGDCQVFARTACIHMDCMLMLSEWLKDLAIDQREDGAVPYIVPHVLGEEEYGSAAWGDAAVIVPWTLYQCYGDERVLRRQYDSMKAWLRFIGTQSQDYLWNGGRHFGDWLGLDAREGDYVGATDKTLIATAYYAHAADIMACTAEVLGYGADAQEFETLRKNIIRAFRREFITPAGRLAVRTQTAFALTLQFEMAEEAGRQRLIHDLIELIQESDGHLTTGFVGTPYLLKALTGGGAHDVAGRIFMQNDYPSWLYPITKGATTIWEHWDGIRPDGSFWSKDMNSFNHYSYGAVGEWMVRALVGLDMARPGYAALLLHPRPIEGISFASAWQKTRYGRVQLEWRITDDLHEVSCTVPAGATAVLVLEHAEVYQVTESEKLLSEAQGIERAWQSDEDVMMTLQSGDYAFRWRT